jgi:hypothetical protein
MKQEILVNSLNKRELLKVIAGINNFDRAKVLQIANAANRINQDSNNRLVTILTSRSEKRKPEAKRKALSLEPSAFHNTSNICVDIAAREDLIREVLNLYPELPVFVSSVVPSELKVAQDLGAAALELGNYEALHQEGIFYSADEVLDLAREIMSFRSTALVSITVPGHLSVAEQVELASELADLGVDIIQTEGASLVEANGAGALGQIEKARLTLANTIEIARALQGSEHIPYILTASGISPETVPLAIAAGASGIGVGKYVSRLESELEMLAAISALNLALMNKEPVQKASNARLAKPEQAQFTMRRK